MNHTLLVVGAATAVGSMACTAKSSIDHGNPSRQQSALFASASAPGQPVAAVTDIAGLSTRFDRPASLSDWQQHEVPGFSPKWAPPTIDNGALLLRPYSSGWFEDMQGSHLYREIKGNFVVTAKLRVEGTTALLPEKMFSLAGIFIRAPRADLDTRNWQPNRENWLFLALGSAYPAGVPQFEVKTTWNSVSTLRIHDAAAVYEDGRARWVELRVARQGELFSLLHRVEGEAEFTLLDQFIRPDLPTQLAVGLTAYGDWNTETNHYPDFARYHSEPAPRTADLVARVEWIDFRRPTVNRFPLASFEPRTSFMPEVSHKRLDDLVRN